MQAALKGGDVGVGVSYTWKFERTGLSASSLEGGVIWVGGVGVLYMDI